MIQSVFLKGRFGASSHATFLGLSLKNCRTFDPRSKVLLRDLKGYFIYPH
jgi:hypothetical protein